HQDAGVLREECDSPELRPMLPGGVEILKIMPVSRYQYAALLCGVGQMPGVQLALESQVAHVHDIVAADAELVIYREGHVFIEVEGSHLAATRRSERSGRQ